MQSTWALERISQSNRQSERIDDSTFKDIPMAKTDSDLSYEYAYESNAQGEGVTAYVVSEGIYCKHVAFGGRAKCPWRADWVDGCVGALCGSQVMDFHIGTFVAGIIGAEHVGVARKATLFSVRIEDDIDDSSTRSDLIEAVEYVIGRQKKYKTRGLIMLTVSAHKRYEDIDRVITSAWFHDLPIVVSSGGSQRDACSLSPQHKSEVITVAGTTIKDQFFSAMAGGSCVTIMAPGENVPSLWWRSYNAEERSVSIAVGSGTAPAPAYVAGVLAGWLSSPALQNIYATQLQHFLIRNALRNRITDIPADTPNLFTQSILNNDLRDLRSLSERPSSSSSTRPEPLPREGLQRSSSGRSSYQRQRSGKMPMIQESPDRDDEASSSRRRGGSRRRGRSRTGSNYDDDDDDFRSDRDGRRYAYADPMISETP
ncbi:hypothetical protein PYCC9005_001137 [Savitreella phatthalungensis]